MDNNIFPVILSFVEIGNSTGDFTEEILIPTTIIKS